ISFFLPMGGILQIIAANTKAKRNDTKYVITKCSAIKAVSITRWAYPTDTALKQVATIDASLIVYILVRYILPVIIMPIVVEPTNDALASTADFPGTLNNG